MQYAAVCRAQSSQLKSLSCSETPQDDSGLTTPQEEPLSKLCDDVTARIEARVKQQRYLVAPQFSGVQIILTPQTMLIVFLNNINVLVLRWFIMHALEQWFSTGGS